MLPNPEPSPEMTYQQVDQALQVDFKQPEMTSVSSGEQSDDSLLLSSEPASPLVETSSSTPDADQPSMGEGDILANLLRQLSTGYEAMKGLNLEGFTQIYPVFIMIFGAVMLGVMLTSVITVIQTVNNFPLVGGLFQGLFELAGLIVFVRFASTNLLMQNKRAELFARIAVLKKELRGSTDSQSKTESSS